MNTPELDEEKIVRAVLEALKSGGLEQAALSQAQELKNSKSSDIEEGILPDIAAVDESDICLIDEPKNKEAIMRLKKLTPARLATGRVGVRDKTFTMFRKSAFIAATWDAVWADIDPEFVKSLGYPEIRTLPVSKEEYLMRPDLGRMLDEENLAVVRKELKKSPDVQIVLGDGQSSMAIEKGLNELLPALLQGLKVNNIDYGTPVFVRNTRVAVGDVIAKETGAKMLCVILGERPGLLCWTAMACYLTYAPEIGMTDVNRNAITNIQDAGTPPAEAGAYIADVIKRMLSEKKSGTELVL